MVSGNSDGRVVCVQHCSLVKQQVFLGRQGMLTLDVAPDSIHTCCESVSPFLSLISHSNGTDINNSIFPYPLSVVCCLPFCCCCWCFWGDVCVGIGWVLCVFFIIIILFYRYFRIEEYNYYPCGKGEGFFL